MKINILNYDCGNIWSVKNIFNFLIFYEKVINSTNEILSSVCIILPGDGSFKIINDIEKKDLRAVGLHG